jgi:putative DNA primase/helicase
MDREPQNKGFNILNFLDLLTPVPNCKNRYICPVCGGNNLTVNPENGKYQCWNQCECSDIREAIAPWEEKQKAKSVRPKADRTWVYRDRAGREIMRTRRIDDGNGKRQIWQEYRHNGQWISGGKLSEDVKTSLKAVVTPYRYHECLAAIEQGKLIIWVEGEPCADALWKIGIPATTTIGGSSAYGKGKYSGLFDGAKLVLSPDCDRPGTKYMGQVAKDYPHAQWLYPFPDSPKWENLPADKGFDVADWNNQGVTAEQILGEIGSKKLEGTSDKNDRPEQSLSFKQEGEFSQVAVSKLYSGTSWISIDGKLHKWMGTHYEFAPDEIELQRIQSLAETISYYSKKMARTVFPYAASARVKAALEWAKMKFAVLPESINPPGLNCLNGVLQVSWRIVPPETRPNSPEFVLLPHSPDLRYIYAPIVKYEPDADSKDCDQLLTALDEAQCQVFLKTISSAFDIDTVRKFHGRNVRALLCKGVGSNGKDALREAVALLWGRTGMTSVALEDFAQYDEGRKFPLSPLASSRINWASENRKSVSLDSLQSLKRAITGDPLHYELKGKDHKEFQPKAIHLFNVNEIPYLKGSQEAIQSRFSVLSFNKIFKKGANPDRGEIEADPRFKYDADFVESNILPSLLNRLIAAFKSLMMQGIDFACCDAAMQEIQINQSYLYEFALEQNLVYDPDSIMPISDLWAHLENYYRETGVLQIEVVGDREIRKWEDPNRPGDQYVKGQNQVAQRFISLYPQCQKVPLGKNRYGIRGLTFKAVEPSSVPLQSVSDAPKAAQHQEVSDLKKAGEPKPKERPAELPDWVRKGTIAFHIPTGTTFEVKRVTGDSEKGFKLGTLSKEESDLTGRRGNRYSLSECCAEGKVARQQLLNTGVW